MKIYVLIEVIGVYHVSDCTHYMHNCMMYCKVAFKLFVSAFLSKLLNVIA